MAKKQYFQERELIFKEKPTGRKFKDLTSFVYGRFTVIGFAEKGIPSYWFCKCECGNITKISTPNIQSGHTKSCGCLNKEVVSALKTKHGHANKGNATVEYSTWQRMISRCCNSLNSGYNDYGGRGITVCERWQKFENFLADMGQRPSKEYSIDRIDVNGNYCPENCRWATPKEQANNKRSNRLLGFNGIVMNMTQWAEKLGVNMKTIHDRIDRYGWTIEKTLTTPSRIILRK